MKLGEFAVKASACCYGSVYYLKYGVDLYSNRLIRNCSEAPEICQLKMKNVNLQG